MKFTCVLAIIFFFLVLSPFGTVMHTSLAIENISEAQGSSAPPLILYAQWSGKTLVVQGRNFAEDATILVDGQRLKTISPENSLGFELFARKAKKKVARNQAITLQVQNPNGETSDPFTFYSGFVITMHQFGDTIHLSVGDKFLLFLDPQGDPPAVRWSLDTRGDTTILSRSTDNLPIPNAQGFFEAVHQGQVTINVEASPLCPPRPRWQCEQSGANFGRFALGVVVD